MANVKFFNCVEFPVNFRMTWVKGNPAIKLQPGQVIEGPYELLISYNFLRPLGTKVSDPTTESSPSYQEEVKRDIEYQESKAVVYKKSFKEEETAETSTEEKQSAEVITENSASPVQNSDIPKLPFEIEGANWIKISIDDLLKAAEILNVLDDDTRSLPGKKLKWELIRRIKKATGKV